MFDFTFNVLKMHFIVTYVDRQHSLEIVKSDVSARFVLYFITNNLKWELVKPIKKMVTYRIYIFVSKLSFSLVFVSLWVATVFLTWQHVNLVSVMFNRIPHWHLKNYRDESCDEEACGLSEEASVKTTAAERRVFQAWMKNIQFRAGSLSFWWQ